MVALDRTVGAAIGVQTPIGEKAFGTSNGTTSIAAPFSGVLRSIVDQTETLSKQAGEAVTGLLNGQGVEIHDVMIASQKANVAFELALQVRNKAVAAYQQLMGMQF